MTREEVGYVQYLSIQHQISTGNQWGRLELQEGGHNQELLLQGTCQKCQRFSLLLMSIQVPLCFPKFLFFPPYFPIPKSYNVFLKFLFFSLVPKCVKDFIFQWFVSMKSAISTQPVVPSVNMFLGTEQYNPTDLQRSCKPSWQCLRQHKGSVSITPIYGKPKAIYLLDSPEIFYSLVNNHELLLGWVILGKIGWDGKRMCLSKQPVSLAWLPNGATVRPSPLP